MWRVSQISLNAELVNVTRKKNLGYSYLITRLNHVTDMKGLCVLTRPKMYWKIHAKDDIDLEAIYNVKWKWFFLFFLSKSCSFCLVRIFFLANNYLVILNDRFLDNNLSGKRKEKITQKVHHFALSSIRDDCIIFLLVEIFKSILV